MKKLLLIMMISLSSFTYGYDLHNIMNVLKQVESRGNPLAIGDNGKAYGILQIHKVCVDETNRVCGTNYTHNNAFNVKTSEDIFIKLMSYGIKRFKNKYGRNPTEEEVVRWWNGGIYTGHLKKATIKYYKQYLKIKKKMNKSQFHYYKSINDWTTITHHYFELRINKRINKPIFISKFNLWFENELYRRNLMEHRLYILNQLRYKINDELTKYYK